MRTTKVLEFLSKVTLANSLLSMSLTRLVVDKASATVYDFQVSFFGSANSTSILLRDRKGILRTTFILVSASEKVSSKNQNLSRLSWSENLVKAIPWVFRSEPWIFWASTLVFQAVRPSSAAFAGVIALTSLPESISALISWSSWNRTGYQMQGTRYRAFRAWALASASELAVINVEVVKTVASFLAWYNRRRSDPFCCNYSRWL